ncbi:MAG: hypothetical protein ACU0A5_10740 [Salipiger marinus]
MTEFFEIFTAFMFAGLALRFGWGAGSALIEAVRDLRAELRDPR